MTARGWLSTWSGPVVPRRPGRHDAVGHRSRRWSIHPTADTEIRLRQAEPSRSLRPRTTVTYVELAGAPHYLHGHRREACDLIADWIRTPPALMRRVHRLSGVLAWTAVVFIALGVVIALIPVRTPGVQDCGMPIDFLVGGDFDRLPDAVGADRARRAGRSKLDPQARERASEHPCSERVERRAIPAGTLVVVGSLMGHDRDDPRHGRAWRRATSRAHRRHRPSPRADRAEVA